MNRICLAADIPLIESGTAGYLGQVTVIKKVSYSIAMNFSLISACREKQNVSNVNQKKHLKHILYAPFALIPLLPFIVLFGPSSCLSKWSL